MSSSLYTCEGQQVTDGNQLEIGQLYVAVGREKFKKLSYSDVLFSKLKGTRRAKGYVLCTLENTLKTDSLRVNLSVCIQL